MVGGGIEGGKREVGEGEERGMKAEGRAGKMEEGERGERERV